MSTSTSSSSLKLLILILAISYSLSQQAPLVVGTCLRNKIISVMEAGCNFAPDPSLLKLFSSIGSTSIDTSFGLLSSNEAVGMFPHNKLYSDYVTKSVQHPTISIFGDTGSGMMVTGEYINVHMGFINLCSDDGRKSSYIQYEGIFVVPASSTQASKEEIRRAAWQLICLEKNQVYKRLLSQ